MRDFESSKKRAFGYAASGADVAYPTKHLHEREFSPNKLALWFENASEYSTTQLYNQHCNHYIVSYHT